jgi:hypothetical protein
MDCFNDSDSSGDNSDTRLAYSGFILIRGFSGVIFSGILLQYTVQFTLLKNDFCPGFYRILKLRRAVFSCNNASTVPAIIPK